MKVYSDTNWTVSQIPRFEPNREVTVLLQPYF